MKSPATSPATVENSRAPASQSSLDKTVAQVSSPNVEEGDDVIVNLSRTDVLELPRLRRMRWFFLLQVKHRELIRVTDDLSELLEPDNEVKIIALIGMTGIGKTTLLGRLLEYLVRKFGGQTATDEVPIVYVAAPANGAKSLSWTALYRKVLVAGNEPLVDKKTVIRKNAEGKAVLRGKPHLWELREMVEALLKNRNVRVLVIDEVLHLLRFDTYAETMDTLKSLADVHSCKLVLVGHYDLVDLVCNYGQVSRRGEIIHFKRYVIGTLETELTPDQRAFKAAVKKFEDNWPNARKPNLIVIWFALMRACLGSIGLLKVGLLRLAILQSRSKDERLTKSMVTKAFKSPKALQQIEEETVRGEAKLEGLCYGDHGFSEEELQAVLAAD